VLAGLFPIGMYRGDLGDKISGSHSWWYWPRYSWQTSRNVGLGKGLVMATLTGIAKKAIRSCSIGPVTDYWYIA
jgi:hypothetical protein